MRKREVESVGKSLARLGISKNDDGWYVWGKCAIRLRGNAVQREFVKRLKDGHSYPDYMRRETAAGVLDWLLSEWLEFEPLGFDLHSSYNKARIQLRIAVLPGPISKATEKPIHDPTLWSLAFGVFTGEVPVEMFHDALLHDTDILDEKPK